MLVNAEYRLVVEDIHVNRDGDNILCNIFADVKVHLPFLQMEMILFRFDMIRSSANSL